jgi:short-subunit dehydrogenase involved in D-alanine esterification of teichoic acids
LSSRGSGIGRDLAEALHKLGNKVITSGRRRAKLDEVVTANPGMVAVELDITDPVSIDRVAARLIADYPDLNVLFNNAGSCCPIRPLAGSTTSCWSIQSRPICRADPHDGCAGRTPEAQG